MKIIQEVFVPVQASYSETAEPSYPSLQEWI